MFYLPGIDCSETVRLVVYKRLALWVVRQDIAVVARWNARDAILVLQAEFWAQPKPSVTTTDTCMLTGFQFGQESEASFLTGITNFLVLANGTILYALFVDVSTIRPANRWRELFLAVVCFDRVVFERLALCVVRQDIAICA
jgi:hypothetical protein